MFKLNSFPLCWRLNKNVIVKQSYMIKHEADMIPNNIDYSKTHVSIKANAVPLHNCSFLRASTSTDIKKSKINTRNEWKHSTIE